MNASLADAPQELQFRLRVDKAHCDRAAQGLRLMAQYQYRSSVRRFERMGWFRLVQPRARKFAPALAVVAFAGGLAATWAAWVNVVGGRHVYLVLAAILFSEALALRVLAPRADQLNAVLRIKFENLFGDRAAGRMRAAQQAAPFEAVYALRGDQLTYSRIDNGQSTQRWLRHLGKFQPRGVALQTPGLLAIFRKPIMVLPAIVILTADDGAMAAAIRALGWTIVELDPTAGEPSAGSMAA